MNLFLMTFLILLAAAAGGGVGLEWEKVYPTQPVPRYTQDDCWEERRTREPWELYPDGRVMGVGNWHYLVATREKINSNDRYHGGKAYESMVEIRAFDQHTRKVPCPGKWK
jgi:hypothetical protein